MTGDERYDIRPNNEGGWDVVDTANRYGTVSSHKTHAEALKEATRRDTP
jgi:aryl-alcohol dehydrogenase-like predicted oxidoreductase